MWADDKSLLSSAVLSQAGAVDQPLPLRLVVCGGRASVFVWTAGASHWSTRHDVLVALASDANGFLVDLQDELGPISQHPQRHEALLIAPMVTHRLHSGTAPVVVVSINVTHPDYLPLKKSCLEPVSELAPDLRTRLRKVLERAAAGRLGVTGADALVDATTEFLGGSSLPGRPSGSRLEWALNQFHHSLDIPFEDLARSMDVKPSSLSHMFTADTGLPYRSLVAWRRMVLAVELLYWRPEVPTSWVAHLAGYSHASHMHRALVHHLGVEASALRDPSQVQIVGLRPTSLLASTFERHLDCDECRQSRDAEARAKRRRRLTDNGNDPEP